jgi:hypothetical protein
LGWRVRRRWRCLGGLDNWFVLMVLAGAAYINDEAAKVAETVREMSRASID